MAHTVDSPRIRRIAWILTFAGAIPFAVATGFLFAGDSHVRVPAIAALVTYSAVVLSFLGGIEWGLALREEAGRLGRLVRRRGRHPQRWIGR